MAQSLAVKYRPKQFSDVCSQQSIITILKRQLELNEFTNCYGFCGPSGCGKTTLARIFANEIKSEIIEIDGASNNGVDNIRNLIDMANERTIDPTKKYKVFIIDECHMITTAGWNAFLKTIEEPPKYSIFMFCTTNPEKIPATIINRIMKFNLSKVDTALIKARLLYICKEERYTNYEDACDYISKLCQGGVRDSIATLEKCANYSTDLNINNVLDCLGDFSYDSLFNLTGAILNEDYATVLEVINNYYSSGKDLKLFVDQYLDFLLDLSKYCLFKNLNIAKIPVNLKDRCDKFSGIPNILNLNNLLIENVLNIKNTIKYDVSIKTTVEAMFIKLCRSIRD